MSLPIVAVVGRPNVGKSTLVNRIAEATDAIVHEQRGVTRDRSYHRADWAGVDFTLVDTGGIATGTDDPFSHSVTSQAFMAAEEADAIIVVVDGTTGLTSEDEDVAKRLRGTDVPVLLAVNKMDNPARDDALHDFWAMGLGEPWPISATHGHGTGDLLDALVDALPAPVEHEDPEAIRIAIIGRPNAGKSSLLNQLTGTERSIVSEIPGTTRDALDIAIERDETRYVLVDTAGIRRKQRIDEDVEYYGYVRAMRAIDDAQVALLVVDSSVGVTEQDQRVARFSQERGCALIVLMNKWDTVEGEERREELAWQVEKKLGFVGYAPLLRISALTGSRVGKILDAVDFVYEAYTQELSTSSLNRLLTEMREFGHTVTKQRKVLKVNYMTQTGTAPPRFTLFANHPTLADENFSRYVENRLREQFELTGTPIVLKFRSKA